jgi:peptide deformylase
MNIEDTSNTIKLELNPIKLNVPSVSITLINDYIKNFVNSMFNLLSKYPGAIGLAANQVGYALQIFITTVDQPRVFINPEIIKYSKIKTVATESCLSFNNYNKIILRPKFITIKAKDLDNNEFELNANGLLARCIQHEYDHLQGVTISTKSQQ